MIKMNNDKIIVKQEKQEKQGTQWKTIETYSDSEITLDRFKNSFVNERWNGERRYNKQYTKLGYYHTKTIVPNPYSNTRSVRTFIFPD